MGHDFSGHLLADSWLGVQSKLTPRHSHMECRTLSGIVTVVSVHCIKVTLFSITILHAATFLLYPSIYLHLLSFVTWWYPTISKYTAPGLPFLQWRASKLSPLFSLTMKLLGIFIIISLREYASICPLCGRGTQPHIIGTFPAL